MTRAANPYTPDWDRLAAVTSLKQPGVPTSPEVIEQLDSGRTRPPRARPEYQSIYPLTIADEFYYDPRTGVPDHDMPRHMRRR